MPPGLFRPLVATHDILVEYGELHGKHLPSEGVCALQTSVKVAGSSIAGIPYRVLEGREEKGEARTLTRVTGKEKRIIRLPETEFDPESCLWTTRFFTLSRGDHPKLIGEGAFFKLNVPLFSLEGDGDGKNIGNEQSNDVIVTIRLLWHSISPSFTLSSPTSLGEDVISLPLTRNVRSYHLASLGQMFFGRLDCLFISSRIGLKLNHSLLSRTESKENFLMAIVEEQRRRGIEGQRRRRSRSLTTSLPGSPPVASQMASRHSTSTNSPILFASAQPNGEEKLRSQSKQSRPTVNIPSVSARSSSDREPYRTSPGKGNVQDISAIISPRTTLSPQRGGGRDGVGSPFSSLSPRSVVEYTEEDLEECLPALAAFADRQLQELLFSYSWLCELHQRMTGFLTSSSPKLGLGGHSLRWDAEENFFSSPLSTGHAADPLLERTGSEGKIREDGLEVPSILARFEQKKNGNEGERDKDRGIAEIFIRQFGRDLHTLAEYIYLVWNECVCLLQIGEDVGKKEMRESKKEWEENKTLFWSARTVCQTYQGELHDDSFQNLTALKREALQRLSEASSLPSPLSSQLAIKDSVAREVSMSIHPVYVIVQSYTSTSDRAVRAKRLLLSAEKAPNAGGLDLEVQFSHLRRLSSRELLEDEISSTTTTHGFDGKPTDLRKLRNKLQQFLPPAPFAASFSLLATANQYDTASDIELMGQRLAKEVVTFLEASRIQLGKTFLLSFIGHSIGGLIIRSALSAPALASYKEHFYLYCSLSSPHLGYRYGFGLFNTGLWAMQKWRNAQSLRQLLTKDMTEGGGESCLLRIAKGQGLKHFKTVVLFSCENDLYVPLHSARMEHTEAAGGDRSQYGKEFREMVSHVSSRLQSTKVVKIHISPPQLEASSSVDVLTGRSAHISFLDSDAVAESCAYHIAFHLNKA